MERLREHGTIPFLSWASQSVPSSLDQPDFNLSSITNGAHDAYIREFAEVAKEWGHPFFLRFDAEMNGFWFPWSEGVNGNKPRRIRRRLAPRPRHLHRGRRHQRDLGLVPERRLHPQPDPARGASTPATHTSTGPASTASTGARPATRPAGRASTRSSTRPTSGCVKIAPNKPMVIGEIASEERGGSKAAWIENTLQDRSPASTARSARLIWFDEKDQGMHWPIESSKSATNAFANGIPRPRLPAERLRRTSRRARSTRQPATARPPA